MDYTYEKLVPPISKHDKASIKQLYERFEDNPNSEYKFQWFFDSDYFHQNNIITFVVRYQGIIVGFTSLLLRTQKTVRIGSMINFLVDVNHRTLTPALNVQRVLLSYVRKENACDILLGMPNQNSLMICKRIGYQIIDSIQRFVFVADFSGYFNHTFPLTRWLNHIYKLVLKIGLGISLYSAEMKTSNCQLKKMCILDRRDFDPQLLSDYEYWRYLESPDKNYYFYTIPQHADRMSPMLIFCFLNKCLYIERFRNVEVDDLEVMLPGLMLKALPVYRYKSVNIDAILPNSFRSKLSQLGFIDRTGKNRPLIAMNISTSKIQATVFPILDGDLDI